jgi:ribonuclease P/MRP protein subunit RPP40
VFSEKDVCILVHKSLKPSQQCLRAATRVKQVLGQLSRALGYRDKDTFLKLYCVYGRPQLEYAIQSWSPWLIQDKEVLEKVQRRALKMVSDIKGNTYK